MFAVKDADGFTVEISSLDTGWISGRAKLTDGLCLELPLNKDGSNLFSVAVFDEHGQPMKLENSIVTITKTVATIGAIPASQSIGVEVMSALGGEPILEFLIQEGDDLPKKGVTTFKAGQTLKAGTNASLNIKLWEGGIKSPVTDNRFIGVIKIMGTDFDEGVITTGAELVCEYEMGDSGSIHLEISVPSIGATFGDRNFYSRQEGQQDVLDTDKISDGGSSLVDRIEALERKVDDDRLRRARQKAQSAANVASEYCSQEDVQKAANDLLEAKKLVFEARKEHLAEIRQADLDSCVEFFEETVRKYAKPTEITAFENQAAAAQRAIERNDPGFENQLHQMKGKNFEILWRQDWFVIDWFSQMVRNPRSFVDQTKFEELKRMGERCVQQDRIEDLRGVIHQLWDIQVRDISIEDMMENANIIRG